MVNYCREQSSYFYYFRDHYCCSCQYPSSIITKLNLRMENSCYIFGTDFMHLCNWTSLQWTDLWNYQFCKQYLFSYLSESGTVSSGADDAEYVQLFNSISLFFDLVKGFKIRRENKCFFLRFRCFVSWRGFRICCSNQSTCNRFIFRVFSGFVFCRTKKSESIHFFKRQFMRRLFSCIYGRHISSIVFL